MLFTKNKTESKSEDDLLVEMIHNEFRNAHLELQRIAENKLESIPSANIGKISRLQALGFNKTKEVELYSEYYTNLKAFISKTISYTQNHSETFEEERANLLKDANLLQKEKNKTNYKKDKHKKQTFNDGY